LGAGQSKLKRERLDLGLPLLIVKGSKGFLACAYIAVDTCNKTNEACAIVSGVQSHEDMLEKEVKAVSEKAGSLGARVGMKGREVIELFR
jgi:uncharacterized protein YunC (DUF1805 family)